MTLQELNRYLMLQTRLIKSKEMLESFKAASYLGAQVLTGMPHTTGISDKVSNFAIEIADLESRILELGREFEQMKEKVTAYINRIQDEQTRMIFRLRFLHGMTWDEVAVAIGGRNTGRNISNICYRYLKS